MREKAGKEDGAYINEVRKYQDKAKQNKGVIPNRRQNISEKVLFEKQGGAGINFNKYSDIKVEMSGNLADTIKPLKNFKDLGKNLPRFLSKNIELMRYDHPTPIQSNALPVALNNRDLMCCAQTGSGKTCAFLLPVVSSLHQRNSKQWASKFDDMGIRDLNTLSCAPKALVLAPTRELAMQIEVEAEKLCNASGVFPAVVYGGANAKGQLMNLAKGMDILVATPGRLQDFVDRHLVSLRKTEFLILDEADRMLDMGFEPQIRKLVQRSGMPPPKSRQTFMFSATFPTPMQKLAREFLNDYIWIGVGRVGSTTSSITQRLVKATNNKREKMELLKSALLEKDEGARTLVFVKKKSTARWVSKQLRSRQGEFQISSAEIHGDRSQSQRESALAAFRAGDIQILVATDVAARGLDIDDVEHVINFDLGATADEFDSYVHRIGRTGRAGKKGLATSFYVPGYDKQIGCGPIAKDLLHLLKESKQEIPDWFMRLPEIASGGGGGKQKGSSAKFGGRDIRKNDKPSNKRTHDSSRPQGQRGQQNDAKKQGSKLQRTDDGGRGESNSKKSQQPKSRGQQNGTNQKRSNRGGGRGGRGRGGRGGRGGSRGRGGRGGGNRKVY